MSEPVAQKTDKTGAAGTPASSTVELRPEITAPVSGTGPFDEHNPPAQELIDECVHCGFCLPTCPTYQLWGEEMDSPRGRIYLMKLGREGKVKLTDTFASHFDRCLGCMACLPACPSGVKYDKLIEATRAQLQRRYQRSLAERLYRRLIFAIFPYPARLSALLRPLWLYQRSGLQRRLRNTGVLKLLPRRLRGMESLLPAVPPRASRVPALIPAQGPRRRRVGLLLGCVQRVMFPEVNAATARVLSAEGCEVVVPEEQGCCGALMIHAGWEAPALDFARRLMDVFERAGVDAVVINAAGCGSNMKDYGYLLRGDPQYAEKARKFSARCKDVSEVLAELEPRAPRHPLRMRIAYHDACHLQHAQGVRHQPRQVLKTIPQLELVEIPDSAICCGSAGIYNLVEAEAAEQLGDRKAQNCLATGAEAIVSANPGCLLQIAAGLRRARRPLPLLHLIELLDASISGAWPASLRNRQSH